MKQSCMTRLLAIDKGEMTWCLSMSYFGELLEAMEERLFFYDSICWVSPGNTDACLAAEYDSRQLSRLLRRFLVLDEAIATSMP